MMHHGNIDRLWAVWNHRCRSNSTDSLWTSFSFVNNFRNPSGANYTTAVSSQLSTVANGYRYGLGVRNLCNPILVSQVNIKDLMARIRHPIIVPPVPPIPPRPTPPRGAERLSNLSQIQIRSNAVSTLTAEPLTVLSVPIRTNIETIQKAIKQPSAAGIGSTFDLNAELAQRKTPARVVALLSEIVPPSVEETEVRIFMNCDYLSSETSTNDPHYVGTFSFFATSGGHIGHGNHAHTLSMALDVTEALQRLQRNGRLQDDQIRFQMIPVGLSGVRNAKIAPLKIGKIELATI
jgi:tyrosinase